MADLPQFLADVGRVSAIGPTIHVELGQTTPDGNAVHRAHVMLSREFARSLAETLLKALDAAEGTPR
jgi:hypothetical protein